MTGVYTSFSTIFAFMLCSLASTMFTSFALGQRASDRLELVYLADIDGSIQQEIRYATSNNFMGRPVNGYLAPECILTRATAEALRDVQGALPVGLSLKVYDCYRPARGVGDFVQWSRDTRDTKMKHRFYPDIDKRDLFGLGYIAGQSMHSRGNTVDLTIIRSDTDPPPYDPAKKKVRCDAPKKERSEDNSLDFGTDFDCFDPKSSTASTQITAEAQRNRQMLVKTMAEYGFQNYHREWWHFELVGAATSDANDKPIVAKKPKDGGNQDAEPGLSRDKCPIAVHKSGRYSVDCKGNTVEIKVYRDRMALASDKDIVNYEEKQIEECVCEFVVMTAGQKQEWCQISYRRKMFGSPSIEGWVLFDALQNARRCRRAQD
jgi:zinc D-Ala-D-Ala dipeptidase